MTQPLRAAGGVPPAGAYERIIDSLGGILWEADGATFQFFFVSPRAEAVLGYPLAEWLTPGFWQAHTHPDDVEWATAFCLDTSRHGRDHLFEYRMLAADGRVVWIRDMVTVVRLPDGTTRLRGIMLDVTDRVRAEEYFRTLVEHAWDTVAVLTPDGVVRYVSPAVQRMLGHEPEGLLGRPALALVHRGDRPAARDFLRAVFADGRAELAYRARHRDRSWRVLETVGRRILDRSGQEVAVLNTRDVTERRALEEQLLQAQKMEAIGRLAGGVAHDFNNLLTVIGGYCDFILAESPPGDPRREDAEEIRRAAERAALLTQQLLAFSRKQVLHPQALDVNAVVRDLARMLGRLIGEDVAVELRLAPAALPALLDAGQLQQVLMNLAVNARDAMPRGGRLTIETGDVTVERDEPAQPTPLRAGRYVRLAVRDTGVGMRPEVLSRCLEPFFTTKEAGKGTGLGLSTVYGIVTQSRGHLRVASTPGGGTTFELFFPRAEAPAADRVRAPSEPAARGTETVLLVEDDATVRGMAARALERAGYRVLAAAGAAEAARLAREHGGPIDLLVTDVVMPGQPGPELAARLEAARPRIRVLYMSGYADDTVIRHGVNEGGVSFLAKPFTPDALTRRVREVLDS